MRRADELSLLRQVHAGLAAWTSSPVLAHVCGSEATHSLAQRGPLLESHKAEIRVFPLETLVVTLLPVLVAQDWGPLSLPVTS